MTPALSAPVRDKLVNSSGSNHAGERDAAGLAAERLVRQHNLTWRQILSPAPEHREPLQSTWRDVCAKLMKRSAELRPWKKVFVGDLPKFRRLSTKQRYVLFEISKRILGEATG